MEFDFWNDVDPAELTYQRSLFAGFPQRSAEDEEETAEEALESDKAIIEPNQDGDAPPLASTENAEDFEHEESPLKPEQGKVLPVTNGEEEMSRENQDSPPSQPEEEESAATGTSRHEEQGKMDETTPLKVGPQDRDIPPEVTGFPRFDEEKEEEKINETLEAEKTSSERGRDEGSPSVSGSSEHPEGTESENTEEMPDSAHKSEEETGTTNEEITAEKPQQVDEEKDGQAGEEAGQLEKETPASSPIEEAEQEKEAVESSAMPSLATNVEEIPPEAGDLPRCCEDKQEGKPDANAEEKAEREPEISTTESAHERQLPPTSQPEAEDSGHPVPGSHLRGDQEPNEGNGDSQITISNLLAKGKHDKGQSSSVDDEAVMSSAPSPKGSKDTRTGPARTSPWFYLLLLAIVLIIVAFVIKAQVSINSP